MGKLGNRKEIFEQLSRFQSGWVSHGWSWDRRFECVASTFAQSLASEATGLVGAMFPELWTSATLNKAPDAVIEIAEATGGVRSDQLLYATKEVDELIAYGLWWPWGSEGTNISLRIGVTGRTSYDDTIMLQKTFGAADD